jgi:methionyl-tRNA synthetase
MTRDLDWGVPVPLPQAEGKVLYVWFDAPIGYISATKELLGERWKEYWQREDTKLVHFIGKDNIVFHCITFPSMLMEHGDYHLPDEVPANEFLNLEGRKISTSRNWAVWLHEYVADFPGKEDALRYCLCANAPETKDNDFTWKDFQNRNNNELVAVLGNFVNRVLVLLNKYYAGKVPAAGTPTAAEEQLQGARREAPGLVATALERYRFREAQLAMMQLAREGNKYLTEEEPWKTQKSDPARTETVMHEAAQTAALLSQLMEPFLPFAADRLRGYLHLPLRSWQQLGEGDLLPTGHVVEKGDLLFEKVSDEAVEAQKQKLEKPAPAEEKHPPLKEEMDFETFTQQDLRVGTITAAAEMPKADKLLKLQVDLGFEQRTIVSGIRQHFDAANLPGQRVTVVANLAPRKLRGVESQGMILMAENADGSLRFVAPPAEAENGAVVR